MKYTYTYKEFSMEATAVDSFSPVVGVSSQMKWTKQAPDYETLFKEFKEFVDKIPAPKDLEAMQEELEFCKWNITNAHKQYATYLKKHGYVVMRDCTYYYAVHESHESTFETDRYEIPGWAIRSISDEIAHEFA